MIQGLLGMGPHMVRAPTVNTTAGARAIKMQSLLGADRVQSGAYSLAAGARGGNMALARREAQRRGAMAGQELAGQGIAQTAQMEQAAASQNASMSLQAGMANAQAAAQADAAEMAMIGAVGGAAMMSDEHSKKRIFDLERENAGLRKAIPTAVGTGAASILNPFAVIPGVAAVGARRYIDSRRGAPQEGPATRPLLPVHEGPDTGPDEAAALAIAREREAMNRREQERDVGAYTEEQARIATARRKLQAEPGSGGRMAQTARVASDEKTKKALVDLDKQTDVDVKKIRGTSGDADISAGLDAADAKANKDIGQLRKLTRPAAPYSIFDDAPLSERPVGATSPYPRVINPSSYSIFDEPGAGPRPQGARAQVRGGMPMDFSGQRAGAGFGGDYGLTKADVVNSANERTIAAEPRNRALAADAHRQGASARQVLGISDADAAAAFEQERRGLPAERVASSGPEEASDDGTIPQTSYDPAASNERWRSLMAEAERTAEIARETHRLSDERTKRSVHGANLGLENVRPVSFEYKEPHAQQYGVERQYGVLAQDLERAGPATRSLVDEDPQGTKMVDTNKATMLLLAQAADSEKRLRKLEGGGKRKRSA